MHQYDSMRLFSFGVFFLHLSPACSSVDLVSMSASAPPCFSYEFDEPPPPPLNPPGPNNDWKHGFSQYGTPAFLGGWVGGRSR